MWLDISKPENWITVFIMLAVFLLALHGLALAGIQAGAFLGLDQS